MRTPQFFFFRGSTPVLELALPFALEAGDAAVLTLAQDGWTVLEYSLSGSTGVGGTMAPAEDDPTLLLVEMTQADTLRLQTGDCELQLRVRTDAGAETFCPVFGQIGQARKQGVI